MRSDRGGVNNSATVGWTAIVLAGGRGTRMNGTDKPQVTLHGRPLLSHVVDTIPREVPVIIVGPAQPTPRHVRWVRESPLFGGPVAAIASAVPLVTTPLVGVIAADMPWAGHLLSALAQGWSGEQAIVPVDVQGRSQALCSVWSTDAVRQALTRLGDPNDRPMRDLLSSLPCVDLPVDAAASTLLVDVDDLATLAHLNTVTDASWVLARAIATGITARLDAERIAIYESDGRVLSDEVIAARNLPGVDNSAVDGWALCGAGPWRIREGAVLAGDQETRRLQSGECVRISTGAPIPEGATQVQRWEDASVEQGMLVGDVPHGANIRRSGEECQAGDVVLPSGVDVTPAIVGLLAALGHDHALVVRRPRVHLLILGDELLECGVPAQGRIRDALGPQIPGWLSRAGATVTRLVHLPDQRDSVSEALLTAQTGDADIVVTTGGTADGQRDHLRAAITAVGGQPIIRRVTVKPGHPMMLANLTSPGGRPIPLVGLPGNPLAAVAGLATLALPVIDTMLGRNPRILGRVETTVDLHAPSDHTRLIAGNATDGRFTPSPFAGSAMLRGLAMATGFAVVQPGLTRQGEMVEWLALP